LRRIVHISDIHFGKINLHQVQPLTRLIHELKPDLTVISGDLTQRAKKWQFRAARHFLDGLPTPQIVIPGNHDVPLYNLFARFFFPLTNYRKFITDDLEPFYADDEIAVQGVNTARSLTFKNGRINRKQIEAISKRFESAPKDATRIVVTHHPFDAPAGFQESQLLGRAGMAINALAHCGADLFLAGHLHLGHIGNTIKRYTLHENGIEHPYAALIISAGTATSSRTRGEANSFNVIEVEPASDRHRATATIKRYAWDDSREAYTIVLEEFYVNSAHGDGLSGWHKPGKPEGATETSTADLPKAEQTEGAAPVEDA
jgi:3',5'-cyclic AMP phosphodiesterase CpdA